MSQSVEFFFDLGSPASYLAWTQLPGMCAKAGATLIYRPMLLGGVFQATGNASPAAIPAKGRYTQQDMARFARRYQVPMRFNPYFPINTLGLMRAVVAVAQYQPQRLEAYLAANFTALWEAERNMGDLAVVGQVLSDAGFDPQQVLAQSTEQAVKDRLKADTAEAVQRGVFGAPTFFVGDEMFFGQDRLDFVQAALAR
ncbi:MAG: 2-hydroxychromene-2-carboxylate isomerase [Pseudomonas sp.]|uniref:2-hydroxychromene-2-carboxylate isomerase n=1 Tax=Pseudomonas abieticivorans TaxID=2931382 RepID=UPI0020BF009C|nr:2-hydroxychromene-2-carboxylate isomerase [Pseudomonas sp. PIA16]MDE1169553.1 2-hydroxychromene-2-carboxylate isomerase [Pseudomonas sp.]